jgi:hypothetical protein
VKALVLALAALALQGQETPANNRVTWFAIMPEPIPEAVNAVAVEASSQFLRTGLEHSADGRSFARLDGEDWQITADLAWAAGPGRFNVRFRGEVRSGGIADQAIWNYHQLFGFPQGGREHAPKNRLDYQLTRDGVVVATLQRSGAHLMDTDVAYVVPFGDRSQGARLGASVQLPTGDARNWSGDGALDGLLGAAAWRSWGRFRIHGQVERGYLGVGAHSALASVLDHRAFTRAWAGAGYQGEGGGFWHGLGLDVTLAYHESPYKVGIPRVDLAGWQQHWVVTHRALPRWRFGISEDAGSYTNPDITAFVIYRL